MTAGPIRLQKILARAGLGSRRACETLITEGRVSVDGEVVLQLGSKADPEEQEIRFDGQKIAGPGRLSQEARRGQTVVCWMLHKPKGVLCTNADPDDRPMAGELIPERRRLHCVGRLDRDSSGLLLLTNDGELTNLLTHPRYGVVKTYLTRVDGPVSARQVLKLTEGVRLAERKVRALSARFVGRAGEKGIKIELVVGEGHNRQVRRMLAKVDLRCRSLKRIRLGPLKLGNLEEGECRRLTPAEITALRDAARGERPVVDTRPRRGRKPTADERGGRGKRGKDERNKRDERDKVKKRSGRNGRSESNKRIGERTPGRRKTFSREKPAGRAARGGSSFRGKPGDKPVGNDGAGRKTPQRGRPQGGKGSAPSRAAERKTRERGKPRRGAERRAEGKSKGLRRGNKLRR